MSQVFGNRKTFKHLGKQTNKKVKTTTNKQQKNPTIELFPIKDCIHKSGKRPLIITMSYDHR